MAATLTAVADADAGRPASTASLDPAAAILKALGGKLYEHRQRCRLTRTALANRIDSTPAVIRDIEWGRQAGSRRFWAAADPALRANGRLRAEADRARQRQAEAKRRHTGPLASPSIEPLAPYRQVQRVNRTFADHLSTIAGRRRRHPRMIEQATRQRDRASDELAALTETIRTLLRRPDFTHPEVLADLWQTLLTHDPYHSSFLSAAALMELAQRR